MIILLYSTNFSIDNKHLSHHNTEKTKVCISDKYKEKQKIPHQLGPFLLNISSSNCC